MLVFSGVFLPVLISLGIWQLNRAAEKQLLLDQWQQEAVSLDWPDLVALDLSNGRPVTLTGLYRSRSWLLDNRTRGQLPEVDPPEGVFTLQGRISDYPVPPVLGDQPTATGSWPRRVQSLSKEVARAEIPELPGRIVRLSGDHQPGAYRADWQPDLMGPQTHYGYATQWFALAVALTILTVVASYRKSELPKDRSQ